MDSEKVQIELTGEEAVVLLEFLTRLNARRENPRLVTFEDQAEERVLWDVEAVLEKSIPPDLAFAPNYQEMVRVARARVRDPAG